MSSNTTNLPLRDAEMEDSAGDVSESLPTNATAVDTKADLNESNAVSSLRLSFVMPRSDEQLRTYQEAWGMVNEAGWSFEILGTVPQENTMSQTSTIPANNGDVDTDTMEDVVTAAGDDNTVVTATANDNGASADDSSSEDGDTEDNNQDNQTANQQGQAAQVPNTDHFVWVDRGDAVDESSDCKLCMTTPGPDDHPLYVECGHVWCASCLNQYFAKSFTDRDQFPPRCCRREGFDLDVIGMYLEDEVLIHVMEKWEEWTASDPTYCSNAQCNIFIPADRVNGQWAVCVECKVKTCVECKAKEDLHPTPDQHPEPEKDEENRKLAETEGWKYCPNSKCNKLVEKIDGCDTMTCKCGQQFCYRCGNSFEGPYPCTCGGHNDWVGQVQAWANGADGNQANGDNADGGEDEEEEDDSESESESESEEDEDDEESEEEDEDEDVGGEGSA